MKLHVLIYILLLTSISVAQTAKGYVFNDINKNGIKENNEVGISGVCVSNGIDVIITDQNGKWELPIFEDAGLFVIKPSNYSVPNNKNMIPQYSYIHKPYGSPDYIKNGILPTGSLPNFINFPLVYSEESKEFSAIFFGDTQASSPEEVHYINHDVVEELVGTDSKFGVVLGDIVGHDPNLFKEISQGLSMIEIPWYYIFGNHDSNNEAKENSFRDETFKKYFGPSNYAFEYGKVSFIGFNNVYFKENGKYSPQFSNSQIEFLHNYLQFIPKDKLIVMMMHIPIVACKNKEKIFDLLKDRDYTFSISGHAHEQFNLFLDDQLGWQGKEPHHHLINATVSGSWWCGQKDELGIPHATMNDGAPNGYSIIKFSGNTYKVQFKAARRKPNYQMNIYCPETINEKDAETTNVYVNIFAGSDKSVVKMKIGKTDEWHSLQKVSIEDPACIRMNRLTPILKQKYEGKEIENILGWPMDSPSKSSHIWKGKLTSNMELGVNLIKIKTIDFHGQTWEGNRIIYVYK